ncbi:MAG: MerR family transcriptional regulator [Thermodesulfovibrionales bacterium]
MMAVARRLGVSTSTLKRFVKLLEIQGYYYPRRTPGGWYRFTEEDVKILDRIMNQEGVNRHPEKRLIKRTVGW